MNSLSLQLRAIRYQAEGIHTFEFARPDGGELPPFTPGAHIDLYLANGLVRSYSLCNSSHEQHRYVVGINRDRASRGGSAFLHEKLRVGDVLTIGAPRNNFALNEEADHTVLIAGGIGITPLWCMVQRLESLGKSWELHYCARSGGNAAFLQELLAVESATEGRLHLHFDDQMQGQLLDLKRIAAAAPRACHFYCCGPVAMLEAFERATQHLAPAQIHVEYFAAKEAPSKTGGFNVKLARSGKVLQVPQGKSILDVMLEAGLEVPYSCLEGVCATCETRVLDGVPDHRDLVLTKEEQDSNRVIMVCCSGSKSATLVLDC
jgi:vanillate O-demethylase ferredoxin subunit